MAQLRIDAWLEGEYLAYRLPYESDGEVDTDGMLDAFVRIENANDVLAFATTYGPLQLCSHGLPWTHIFELDEGFRELWVPDESQCHHGNRDRVDDWFKWVACARSLLTASAALREGRFPRVAEWDRINIALAPEGSGGPALYDDLLKQEDLDGADLMLSDHLWFWLRMANAGSKVKWLETGERFLLDANTFGEIGIQIMQRIRRMPGATVCSGCDHLNLRRSRKPLSARRNYCICCGQEWQ